jgi:hypothetical protein
VPLEVATLRFAGEPEPEPDPAATLPELPEPVERPPEPGVPAGEALRLGAGGAMSATVPCGRGSASTRIPLAGAFQAPRFVFVATLGAAALPLEAFIPEAICALL